MTATEQIAFLGLIVAIVGVAVGPITTVVAVKAAEKLERSRWVRQESDRRRADAARTARALLERIDELRTRYRPQRGVKLPSQSELYPFYRDIRRMSAEFEHPWRQKLEAIADLVYKWDSDMSEEAGMSVRDAANLACDSARDVLGALIRGDQAPETEALRPLLAARTLVDDRFTAEWEAMQEEEKAGPRTLAT